MAVPYHAVASAHRSDTLALLSANAVHVFSPSNPARSTSLSTSVVVPQPTKPDQSDAIKHAASPKIAFPRIAAFSASDKYLALTGDDKILRVFKVDADDAAASAEGFPGLAEGKEVLLKALPKRAAILRWLQPTEGQQTEELVVVDKFGDLRSFQVGASAAAAAPEAASAPAEGSGAQDQDDMDRPTDPSMKILLGHVSMITDIAFTPQHTATSQPKFVISADRDEHIRISRWGARRAAHIIERFLLGSSSFVGSLCIVEDNAGSGGRYRLVTSDGGKALRTWSLPEAEAEAGPSSETLPSSQACLSFNNIEAALAPYIVAREREEKRREARGYNPGGKKYKNAGKRKRGDGQNGAAEPDAEAEAEVEPNVYEYKAETEATKAIASTRHFTDSTGKAWLLLTVEGSTAFFHLPLSSVLAPGSEPRDICAEVKATVLPSPILDLSLQTTEKGGEISVWTTLDTRSEFQPRESTSTPPALQRLTFDASCGTFELASAPTLSLTQTAIEPFMLSALALYSALTNWPKVDAPSSAEMLASRIRQKGRPANGLLDNAAAAAKGGDEAAEEGTTEENRQVKRMQEGRRARGREKNRADLGLDTPQ